MGISREDVKHVAKLAELEISSNEIERITSKLDKILDYVAEISSVDTADVEPTSHVIDIRNVLREDVAKKSVSQESALKNAPDEQNSGFKVPRID